MLPVQTKRMVPVSTGSAITPDDPASGWIVRRHLEIHSVPRQDPDITAAPHLARCPRQDFVSAVNLHSEHRGGESLAYDSLDSDDILFFGHWQLRLHARNGSVSTDPDSRRARRQHSAGRDLTPKLSGSVRQMTYDVGSVKVLLVSTYELGHQPWHIASPAAALTEAGHEVRTADLSVQDLNDRDLEWCEGLALSVPMHTAMRLAYRVARRVRASHPGLPICAYGLYAGLGWEAGDSIDHALIGEYEPGLLRWVEKLGRGRTAARKIQVELGKTTFRVPDRSTLPDLDRYAHLQIGDDHRQVGYVEASHGCRHRCRHCPIPAAYDGRVRVVDEATVLTDVDQLVKRGARHITFGDADFFNAPAHSLRVVRQMHNRHPEVTFDVTTKVELIIRHARHWAELAASGLAFVVSAFETTNDHILGLLDKGHTLADEVAAVELLRSYDIEARPTWLPFTPWSSLEDLRDIVRFIGEHDLAGNVDPVQLTIRLLIPEGSLLLGVPDLLPYLGTYDRELLGWQWRAADPRVDALNERLIRLLGQGVQDGLNNQQLLNILGGEIMGSSEYSLIVPEGRPRLTEPWFC